MPKHALDRATIAELILSQLSADAEAQLFLLNFERLILRDFSRYKAPREFEGKPPDAVISPEYFAVIKELMKAELPPDQALRLQELLDELNKASSDDARELARERQDEVAGLFRFFPQNCFAFIGGAFFKTFLKGSQRVQRFEEDEQVYFANVKELGNLYTPESPRYSKLPYTRNCGRFAYWLNKPFVPDMEWLYVAPVICDGSFFGLLYRFSNDKSGSVADELRVALTEAETLFRDMRYALIADVAERIGRFEDPLDAFLAELPNYQNVALAANWAEGREPKVYGRAFAEGSEPSDSPLPERQLIWQVIRSTHLYSQETPARIRSLSNLSNKVANNWVDVTRYDAQVKRTILGREHIRRLLSTDVIRTYEEAGLPLQYGVVIPGKLIRPDYHNRHLELYFFEPSLRPGADQLIRGVRRKLYSLIPLLQEIAILESSAEEQARKLNQITAALILHEVKNSLQRKTGRSDGEAGGVPAWLRVHVNRCLQAYSNLNARACSRSDWSEIVEWLWSYWSRYVKNRIEFSEWPSHLEQIKLSKELVYVIACELIKNAITADAQSIKVTLAYEPSSRAAALSVIDDGAGDFSLLQRDLNDYWMSGLVARNRNGLALIMQLLRVLYPTQTPPIDADMPGDKVRITCHLAVTS